MKTTTFGEHRLSGPRVNLAQKGEGIQLLYD